MKIEKEHKKSALMCKTKEQLAELIMTLEYNNNVLHDTIGTQYTNFLKLVDREWTLASENPPEELKTVLVTIRNGEVEKGTWNGSTWTTPHRYSEDVIAWMPLPEPYRPFAVPDEAKQHIQDRFTKVN